MDHLPLTPVPFSVCDCIIPLRRQGSITLHVSVGIRAAQPVLCVCGFVTAVCMNVDDDYCTITISIPPSLLTSWLRQLGESIPILALGYFQVEVWVWYFDQGCAFQVYQT